MEEHSPIEKNPNIFDVFFRLTRAQFIPLIILPCALGAALAFHYYHVFNPYYFALTLLGVVLLHLGGNAIDDCYDYQNGVDQIANSMFPKDFGGWKPIPRRMISVQRAKLISWLLFTGSLLLALLFTFLVGLWSFILGALGVALAVFYTAPPAKLDYRGYALGEMAIFLAFGPVPVLGSFYVQAARLTLPAFLVAMPVGIMTVTILIDHDMIFYEVYRAARKFSLAAVLGKARALSASFSLTLTSYAITIALISVRILPILCLAAPLLSAAILARKIAVFRQPKQPPPYYVPFTANAMFANWVFTLALIAGLLIPLR